MYITGNDDDDNADALIRACATRRIKYRIVARSLYDDDDSHDTKPSTQNVNHVLCIRFINQVRYFVHFHFHWWYEVRVQRHPALTFWNI